MFKHFFKKYIKFFKIKKIKYLKNFAQKNLLFQEDFMKFLFIYLGFLLGYIFGLISNYKKLKKLKLERDRYLEELRNEDVTVLQDKMNPLRVAFASQGGMTSEQQKELFQLLFLCVVVIGGGSIPPIRERKKFMSDKENLIFKKYNNLTNSHYIHFLREYDSVENTYTLKFLYVDKEKASVIDDIFGLSANFKRIEIDT